MYILFLSLWVTAFFIWMNRFRTKSDVWIAWTMFLYGCGGLSEFMRQHLFATKMVRITQIGLMGMGLLWSSHGLLMFALSYTGRMPKTIFIKKLVVAVSFVPIVAICLLMLNANSVDIGIDSVGAIGIMGMQLNANLISLAVVTPYYFGAVLLLTFDLVHRRSTVWRSEIRTSYFLVVPGTLLFYLLVFMMPNLGFTSTWRYCIVLLTIEAIMLLYFVIKENAFGLSFYSMNSTRQTLEALIVEGTGVLQHAMKNNLSMVKFSLQNAKRSYETNGNDEKIRDNIKQSLEVCRNAGAILQRIQLQTNPIRLEMEFCDISRLIEQALSQCASEFEFKDIQIEMNMMQIPELLIDAVHIREVLVNILSNAMEACEDDGSGFIIVSAHVIKKHITIHFEDNGCGIDKKQVKKIGMPLMTSKLSDNHFGLGLYYVKNVINLHNGRFDLRKTHNGRTLAEIILPID